MTLIDFRRRRKSTFLGVELKLLVKMSTNVFSSLNPDWTKMLFEVAKSKSSFVLRDDKADLNSEKVETKKKVFVNEEMVVQNYVK